MIVNEISYITNKLTGKPACPLLDAEVSAVIDTNMAEVTLTQNYINTSPGNIEALYTFPLPHQAVVTGFKARIGNDEVTGTYKESKAAFDEYDKALRMGDSGFLLESHRPDIFQVSLGNIAGGEALSVTISYIEDIQCTDNELRWVLPTVVAPRYIPGVEAGGKLGTGMASPTDQVPDADFITPPVGHAPYTLKLKAYLKGIRGLKKVSSPSHPIVIHVEEVGYYVTLAKDNEPLNRDFVLNVVTDKAPDNRLVLSHHEDEVFGELTLALELEEPCRQSNYEYIFMIDISGSMSGQKLEQAKKALQLSLRNLIEGDRFNIIAFESGYTCFSPESVLYTQENLEKADHWVLSLQALGGTEILNPLRYVFLKQHDENSSRVLFLFTDGQVGNEKEIIQLVKRNDKNLRLFPFGIDTAVNKYFIDSLAQAGNGLPEVVFPGERIDDKVIRQFSRIHQSYISDGKIVQANGAELETVPAIPSRLYGDEEYIFRFRTTDAVEGLTLTGSLGNSKAQVQIPVTARGDFRLLSVKWAKERIRMLEQSLGSGNPRRDENTKKNIIALSGQYGVLSTLTSLVAVYERFNKERGMPETIVVPVAKPESWDMLFPIQHCFAAFSPMNSVTESTNLYADNESQPELPIFMRRNRAGRAKALKTMVSTTQERSIAQDFLHKGEVNCAPQLNEDITDLVREAARKQKADGSFGDEKAISRLTSCFIIALLLLKDRWKPYRIQLIKAGKALLQTGNDASLLKAAAISLLGAHKLLAREDMIKLVKELRNRMGAKQKAALDAFEAGDQDILKNEFPDTSPEEPLAVTLLKMVKGS